MSTNTSANSARRKTRSSSLAKADRLRLAYHQGWTPPPRITVPDWADRYRRLAKEAGAISGNWETSTVEVARGPMMAVTEAGVHVITVMVSTQLLKTALLENIFGYFAHLDPCPMLLLQPKEAAAEQFSKERISPLVRTTPVLRALIGSGKTRSSDETLLYKAFPGGFLALAGAGSPDNLARRPIRILLSDEVDKYPITREGDPIMLAEERTASFGANWLSVRACSPTVEDESRIEKSFLASDQRRASVQCPGCGHRQFPDFFKHVHWQKDQETGAHKPKTARMYCEGCGAEWSEGDRLKSLRSIRWHQTKTFSCCGERHQPLEMYDAAWNLSREGSVDRVWTLSESPRHSVYMARCPTCGGHPVDNEHAGFTASKLYSPWSKDKPADIAGKWLACGDDEEMKLAFYNTQLGLPYRKNSGREIQIEALAARCELWGAEVPDGVALITVGIDCQDYRLEMEVIGWGVNEESWSIDYHVIEGEFDQPETQALLDAYLKRIWYRADGYAFPVMASCFDSGGHHTQAVYDFCKARIGRRVWAVKGESARNGKRSPVWPTKVPSRRSKATYRPVILGVNAAKDTITTRLMKDKPGPGYMHFPVSRDINYFAQLTAERSIIKVTGGVKYRVWEPRPGRANEGLDCRVYGYAALCGLLHMGIKLNKRAEEVNASIGTPVHRPEPQEQEPKVMDNRQEQSSGPRVIQSKPIKKKTLASRLA